MTLTLKATTKAKFGCSSIQRYYELIHVLVERNIKGRYRGSFLGVYWSMLNPLIMTGIYTSIFGTIFASYYDNSIVNYVLAAFTGLVVINFFSASTTQALSSVVSNGGLLNKLKLPISIFPVSMVIANVFQLLIGALPILAVVTLWNSKSLINLGALLFPLIALTLLSTGIGFIVCTLYVFFRDLPYFYEIICFVLWMTSPIFYPAEIVPETVKPFISLNPLLPIIESIRQIALSGDLPNIHYMGQALISGLIFLFLGWSVFRWLQDQFMDLL
ncbi:ABC-2 type transporter [Gloeothece citriformis PCC 7424]|uniref:Transport permease protein n=1 Tax=Gloeothece citriformis (strain PCC 7424) TaxID=65393 RepID=B7K7B9_GLOC7|nr:ABC transporter permease [Gloeothece citriformis]ACK69687.1 ABC-2 type transporter [Gloeothece citriformis PCC 7424]